MTKRDAKSAEDVVAEHKRRMRNDREYRERMKAVDDKVNAAAADRTKAETPILNDLKVAGVRLSSLWTEIPASRMPRALPVLLSHLEQAQYRHQVPEPIARDVSLTLGNHLATKASADFWSRLKKLYLETDDAGQEEGAAIALSGCAKREHYDDLVELVFNEHRGESRILFLRPIRTLGRASGWQIMEDLRDHPILGAEASARIKGRRPTR